MTDYLHVQLLVLAVCITLCNSECVDCSSQCADRQVDLTFVLDGSGSICQDQAPNCQNWKNVLAFVNMVVDHMNIGFNHDRVAVVQFANQGKVEFNLTEHTSKSELQDAISKIQHASQNTNTADGIKAMRKQVFGQPGDRPDVANIGVILTDGKSTRETDRTIPEAILAHKAEIRTFSIGITKSIDKQEVRGISSDPKKVNESYWLLEGFDVLQTSMSVTEQIFRALCNATEIQNIAVPSSDGCPYPKSHRNGLTCYQYQSRGLQWRAAENRCSSLKAHLVAISGTDEQSYVSDLMSQYSAKVIWLGGKSTSKHWTYTANGQILQGQGCYDDKVDSPDLSFKTATIDQLTPQKCIDACRTAKYKYAGVQAGLHCYCGNDFGRYGLVQGCTIACPGDSRYKCGGHKANYIYMTEDVWGEWSENQPNNFGKNQHCGALYYTHQYKFADEACSRKYQYLCDIPNNGPCSGSSASGVYVRSTPKSATDEVKCYYIGVSKTAWHVARQECVSRGGDLAVFLTLQDYIYATKMLDEAPFVKDGIYMWAGVQRKSFQWTNGDVIRYTNWQEGAPSETTDECVVMDGDRDHDWRDITCTQVYPYFCQWDLIPTTTTSTPTTEATTTTVATTTRSETTVEETTTGAFKVNNTADPTPSPPDAPVEQPSLGASTGNLYNDDNVKVLIALMIILILIMIATICVLIYFNCTRRKILGGISVAPSDTKTIKYNIYEPPRYEEVVGTSHNVHSPNLEKPVLNGYRYSKSYTEKVNADFNVDEHVKNIQTQADLRGGTLSESGGQHFGQEQESKFDQKNEKKGKRSGKKDKSKLKSKRNKKQERNEDKRRLELSSDTSNQ